MRCCSRKFHGSRNRERARAFHPIQSQLCCDTIGRLDRLAHLSEKFWQGIRPFVRPRSRKRGRGLLPPSLANGYGIGLTVAAPGFKSPPGVRVITLPGIPPVIVGVAWAGKLSPIAHQFLAEVEIEATVLKRNRKLT